MGVLLNVFCLQLKNFIEGTPFSSQTQLSVIPPFGIGMMCGNARSSSLCEKRVALLKDGLCLSGAGLYNVLRGAIETIPVAGNLAVWGIDKGCESLYQKRITHIKPKP